MNSEKLSLSLSEEFVKSTCDCEQELGVVLNGIKYTEFYERFQEELGIYS